MDAVGEASYQAALEDICGGYNRDGQAFEIEAELVREPKNPYDKNAIAVQIGGRTVGYLPRDQARRVAFQMTADGIARVRCNAKIVGGWRTNQHDKGHFGVRLGVPNTGWIDFGLGKQPPKEMGPRSTVQSKTTRPAPASSGPLVGERIFIWGARPDGPEANELAGLGARIMAAVGKSTTMVVMDSAEITPGMRSSSTFRKARARIEEGAKLEMVTIDALRRRLNEQQDRSE